MAGLTEANHKGIAYFHTSISVERPTLFFVHGLGGCSSAWSLMIGELKNDFNIIAVDLRGHGKSVKPTHRKDYSLKKHANDLREIIDVFGVTKYTLVSHSFGTLVAREHLLSTYDHIASAIFLSPNYGIKKRLSFLFGFPLTKIISIILSGIAWNSTSGYEVDYTKFIGSGDWNYKRIKTDMKNVGLRTYLFCLSHVYSFKNSDTYWQKITMPSMIIHGDKDSIVPVNNAVSLSKRLPNTSLAILKDANHILPLNNSKECAEYIREFALK